MAIGYNSSIVRNGLVLQLDAANIKSYSGSGTAWNDLSTTSTNAVLVNSPVYNTTNLGYFSFNQSSKKATITPISSSSQLTASVWYRRNETDSSTSWRTIFSTASTNIHHLILNSSSRVLGIWDGAFKSFGYLPPLDNKFHNYTVIYNTGTSASLYVDGTFVINITTTLNLSTSPIGTIGNWNGNNYWSGHVSYCSTYNRALNVLEIQQNFNSLRGRYGI